MKALIVYGLFRERLLIVQYTGKIYFYQLKFGRLYEWSAYVYTCWIMNRLQSFVQNTQVGFYRLEISRLKHYRKVLWVSIYMTYSKLYRGHIPAHKNVNKI